MYREAILIAEVFLTHLPYNIYIYYINFPFLDMLFKELVSQELTYAHNYLLLLSLESNFIAQE